MKNAFWGDFKHFLGDPRSTIPGATPFCNEITAMSHVPCGAGRFVCAISAIAAVLRSLGTDLGTPANMVENRSNGASSPKPPNMRANRPALRSCKPLGATCCDFFRGTCCDFFCGTCCDFFGKTCCDVFGRTCCDFFEEPCCDLFGKTCAIFLEHLAATFLGHPAAIFLEKPAATCLQKPAAIFSQKPAAIFLKNLAATLFPC
jgi:hypothetical protein